MGTLKVRTARSNALWVRRDYGCQPRLLCLAGLSAIVEGEVKTSNDKTSLKEFLSTRPALLRILESILEPEETNEWRGNRKKTNKTKIAKTQYKAEYKQ